MTCTAARNKINIMVDILRLPGSPPRAKLKNGGSPPVLTRESVSFVFHTGLVHALDETSYTCCGQKAPTIKRWLCFVFTFCLSHRRHCGPRRPIAMKVQSALCVWIPQRVDHYHLVQLPTPRNYSSLSELLFLLGRRPLVVLASFVFATFYA